MLHRSRWFFEAARAAIYIGLQLIAAFGTPQFSSGAPNVR